MDVVSKVNATVA